MQEFTAKQARDKIGDIWRAARNDGACGITFNGQRDVVVMSEKAYLELVEKAKQEGEE